MIYGTKWTANYGEQDDGTWAKGLGDLTTDQIAWGLEKCRVSGDEWPPTLPIFRMRCLPAPKPHYHRPAQKLPKPAYPPEKARHWLDHIKTILGRHGTNEND